LKHFLGEDKLLWKKSQFLLKLPLFNRVLIDLAMCKYVRTLSILIANHVEIIRTVRIAGKVVSNPVISAELNGIDRRLKGGEKLSAALSGRKFVPAEMIPMLRVGEESGTVGEMLEKIADNLENNTRTRIKRLLSLFEPAVIVFLALLVLVVVVSIFVSMMEINSISGGM
jgi:type II secretory pathway component PulF